MFSRSTQPRLIQEVAKNMQSYDSTTLALISRINTHSYSGSNSNRRNLLAIAKRTGKRLWQSETGPSGMNGRSLFGAALWSARAYRPSAGEDVKSIGPIALTGMERAATAARAAWDSRAKEKAKAKTRARPKPEVHDSRLQCLAHGRHPQGRLRSPGRPAGGGRKARGLPAGIPRGL